MIYANGIVSFLSNNLEFKSIVKRNNKNISLEVMKKPLSKDNNLPETISCRFIAFLPRSFECKSLEDYTGKVKPFLQKSIQTVIVSVEVSHLNYVSDRAMNSRKFQSK